MRISANIFFLGSTSWNLKVALRTQWKLGILHAFLPYTPSIFLYRYLSVKKISGIKTSQKRLDISLECFSNHKCWETPTFCHDYVFCCRFFNPSHAIQLNRTHLATPPEISGAAPQWRYVRWSHQWPKPVDRPEMEIDLEVIAAKYTLEAKEKSINP